MIDARTLTAARYLFAKYGQAAWLLADAKQDAKQPATANAGPAIYICDVESGRTVLLETAAGALQKLSDQAELTESAYNEIRSALPILIADLLASTAGIHPDTRRGIILGSAFCVSETRGFSLTKHHGAGVQHILLRYPNRSTGKDELTPMPVFKSHPVAAVELESIVANMLVSEQLNFPERFTNNRALQFKERRRSVLSG